jgi:hypothetical protein
VKRPLLLLAAFLVVSPVGSAGLPFTGSWDSGIQVVLVQRGTAVCGQWSYRATNSHYEGLLLGKAVGTKLKVEYMCGEPGGTVSTHCPGDTASSQSVHETWEHSKSGALSCMHGLHFEDDETQLPSACNTARRRFALKRQGKRAEAVALKSLRKYILLEPAFAACRGA